MSEMVERVARAIETKLDGFGTGHYLGHEDLQVIARAAIEAMREPTQFMLDDEAVWANSLGEDALNTWRSMIDAALNDKR
jgi:hypothetical protein